MTRRDPGPQEPDGPSDGRGAGREDVFSWFVDRPILTLMVSLTLLLVGTLSFSRLPLALTPDGITASALNIWVPFRGSMPPAEVEDRIVRPFEEQLETIPGIKEIRSRASAGRAFFTVTLESGIDPTLAAAEIRDRAQRAKLEWPEDVDRYRIWREDAGSAPLAFIQLLTPERNADWDYLIDQVLRPQIEAVDGVGRLDVFGILEDTLRIWFDRDKLTEFRIGYGELIDRLRKENFVEPIGELDDGSRRFLLRVDTRFTDEEEIANWPIRTGLKLKDVARVERVPSVRDSLARFGAIPKDDRPFKASYTYTGIVRAAAGSNQVEASNRLVEALEALRRDDPRFAELEWRFLFNQGEVIEQSLETLLETSIQGAGLALVVLWLFLRNLRFTITIALAIPGALLIAGAQLFFGGGSLNILTMAGMTLAVGMVVDNAVVVLENIQRLRAGGTGLRDACVRGTRDVVLPLTMATMTTVVVLMPFVFLGGDGNLRIVLGALGIPLCVALVGSLGVALLLMPSGIAHLSKGTTQSLVGTETTADATRRLRWRTLLNPVELITHFNRSLLALSLRNFWTRVAAVAVAGLLIWSITVPWNALEFEQGDQGPFSGGDVTVNLEIPRGYTLAQVDAEVRDYEQFVAGNAADWKVDYVSSRYGRDSIRFDLVLADGTPKEEIARIGREVRERWPRRPGINRVLRNAGGNQNAGGGSEEKSQSNFVLRLFGPDSDFLAGLALDVQEMLEKLPEVETVEIGSLEGNDEVVVAVDRERMQQLGVDPQQLAQVASAGLRGQELTRFEEEGREVPLIAQFDTEVPGMFDLEETQVVAMRGESFAVSRLADVADIRFERAIGSISRIDGRTQITIVGRRAPEVGSRTMTEILQREMAAVRLPRGYTWEEASASTDTMMQLAQLAQAFPLAVVLVFLLMGILFESVILPGAILVTIPFALFGGVWSLWLFGGAFDVMAGVGMTLLCGVVVNNGIVLLDCIERLRRGGMAREEAILEGTRIRLRPIIMTAATTVAGLLPMAVFGESSNENGLSYVSMSIAVSGGLAFCTVFTAFAVPLMYTFFEDFANWLAGVGRVAWTGKGVRVADARGAAEPSPRPAARLTDG